MTAIAIAAGGGGDAVTAAVLARRLPDLHVAAIMSYSWDRLIIDPTPGPRSAADFDGLINHDGVHEVTPTATLRTGGQSTLARLTQHIDLPILLMDISEGTAALALQIRKAAAAFDASEVVVVDVGGDIVAAGHEPGLRSPLADSVALAAAVSSGISSRVLVAGAGLDGELSVSEVHSRLAYLGAQEIAALVAGDVDMFEPVWSWHPSEANGLLAVAASGWRGTVEVQRDSVIQLVDTARSVYQVDAEAIATNTLAALVQSTSSLAEIEQLLRNRRGYSDIDVERLKLTNRPSALMPTADALAEIDRYADNGARRGLKALTIRRIFELVNATSVPAAESLRGLLSCERPDNFHPPIYTVNPAHALLSDTS